MNSKIFVAITLILLGIQTVSAFDERAFGEEAAKLITVQGLHNFNKWERSFSSGRSRTYLSEEERTYRQIVFLQNDQNIQKHNNDSNNSYKLQHNQFSDMTKEEFAHRVLNSQLKSSTSPSQSAQTPSLRGSVDASLNASQGFDWRNYQGVLGQVKNQGQCGSCWTFATAGVLESYYALKYQQQFIFSEQDIVDCASRSYGYQSDGCNGGFPSEGLQYASTVGLVESDYYPYVAVQGTCRQVNGPRYQLQDQYYSVQQSSSALQYAITRAPTAVGVDASTWQFYHGGVYNGCGQTQRNQLNHAVIAVGYDARGNWIIRNSWGASWGQSGYITLAQGNTCGVLYDNYAINI
ncbi:hypothetical protein ABPG74_005479 [Tetrahymena malaccensis]